MRIPFTIVFCLISTGLIVAQSGPVSTGDKIKGPGGTVDYTVGQVVYMPSSGSNGSALQGMQQPFIIQAVTGLSIREIDLSMVLYPNPTSDFINFKIDKENIDFSNCSYSVFNLNGEQVLHGVIRESETLIPMKDLASATYFVKAFINKVEVKAFRVIKN